MCQTFRLMTYNIQHGHVHLSQQPGDEIDLVRIANEIRSLNADLIVLNEVRGNSDGQADGYTSQAETIASLLGFHCVFGRSIYVRGVGPYGNAILSRYPILESRVIDIPDISPVLPRFEHRSVLRAVIDLPGENGRRSFTVYGTHFGINPGEQEYAVRTILTHTAEEPFPYALAGDFNVTPDSPILRPLYEAMCATDELVPDHNRMTFPSHLPTHKIDYIFAGGAVQPIAADSPRITASDHCPVWCDIRLD